MMWPFKRKEIWKFVGTVEARCVVTFEGVEIDQRTYFNLYEANNGTRRFEEIGEPGRSPAARFAKAQVLGWAAGGPLPPIEWGEDEIDQTAELIVFPGGKGDAA